MKTKSNKPEPQKEPLAKPSLALCVFFHGFSHFRWVRAVFLWIVILYFGMQSSPLFMYYVVGVPKLEKVKSYEGTVRVIGQIHYNRTGKLRPPGFVLDTANGTVSIHCGYVTSPVDCWFLGFEPQRKDMRVKVAYDPYFGVLSVTYIDKYQIFADGGKYEFIAQDFLKEEAVSSDTDAIYALILVLGVYGYWIYRCRRGNKRSPHEMRDDKPA